MDKTYITTFRQANTENGYKNMIPQYCQSAHDLYQKLIAPITKHLKEKLIIVSDGILGYLPFEALLVASPKIHFTGKAIITCFRTNKSAIAILLLCSRHCGKPSWIT